MDIRKVIYFSAAIFIVFFAVFTVVSWVLTGGLFTSAISYLAGVPFIYFFVPAAGLVWFVGHNTFIERRRRIPVWIGLSLSALLWLYVAVIFFFGTTIEIYQSRLREVQPPSSVSEPLGSDLMSL